jgi:CBS domain-containing protein
MKVGEVMSRRVVAATPHATCQDLAKKMLSGFFSGLPVVDEQQRVIGIVTEFDILKVLQNREQYGFCSATAEEIMSKEPVCINEDAEVDEAIRLMRERRFIRLPVVRDGKLVGVISRGDILRAYVQDDFVTLQNGEITGRE